MKTQKSIAVTAEELHNNEMLKAFHLIANDALQLLTPFEAAKYRTIITIDHADNERYPNLVKECISYFWSLNLSKNKNGSLVLYFTADNEATSRFGTAIFNRTLRMIFKHTSNTKVSIEDHVRVATETRDIHNFYYKRFIDGESETVTIQSVDHIPYVNKSA